MPPQEVEVPPQRLLHQLQVPAMGMTRRQAPDHRGEVSGEIEH